MSEGARARSNSEFIYQINNDVSQWSVVALSHCACNAKIHIKVLKKSQEEPKGNTFTELQLNLHHMNRQWLNTFLHQAPLP